MEVVIVAYGFEYVVMAVNNARSIRETNPGVSVRLVTNAPSSWAALHDDFDHVNFQAEPTSRNRIAKIRVHAVTESERVLYLDADSEVKGDLGPLFGFLQQHDLLLRPFDLPSKFRHRLRSDVDGQLYPQFWGGMFAFRRNAVTRQFFLNWEERYVSSGLARDQPALARTVFDAHEVNICPMNAVWGTFTADLRDYPPTRPAPRIYHYADVSNDQAVLQRCRDVLRDLLPRLPEAARNSTEVEQTVRRFHRLSSLAFRSVLLREVAQRWWQRTDSKFEGSSLPARKKRSQTAGEAFGSSDYPLWDN